MRPLPARVAAVAQRDPARIALREAERECSYGELWHQAGAFASRLHAVGVRSGDRVAIILPNHIATVIAWYGTWRAGAVVVPLNAQARARDFRPWLAHCGARVVVCDADNGEITLAMSDLPEAPLRWDAADWPMPGMDAVADAFPDGLPSNDSLAAILYTSGTTGAPKGVALSHDNLAANAESIIAYLGLDAGDSTVTVLPHYYAYGASVINTHLAVGGRIVLHGDSVFPQTISEAIQRERVTGFSGVPSTFMLLLDRGQLDRHDLCSLRYLTQAGGAMSPTLTERVRSTFPGTDLYVMYGQTEASARLTWLPPARLADKLGSVGIAIDGVELQIRGDDGAAVQDDATGEVWARGANIMHGYWRNADATASVLVDGWLRTGDLGRLDDEGFLWLAGRRNDMIKTGAHRVHPQDIEDAIAELPGVREVAVAGVEDELLGQSVAAYIVADAASGLTALSVRAHCRARLATYKIPRRVEFVSELPKTASGKIRRAELAGRANADAT
jgi:long-chain acyl-CoA synthetase